MPAVKSHNPTNAEINRHFVIRYQVATEKGTKLIGSGKYKDLVGEELKIKHFKKVLEGDSQPTKLPKLLIKTNDYRYKTNFKFSRKWQLLKTAVTG